MRTWRIPLLTCLVLAALSAQHAAMAGGIAATATAARPAPAAPRRQHPAHARRFNFSPALLPQFANLKLPGSPTALLPQGWEPAASSSYAEDLHRTTIDLGLRRQFAGHQSAEVGARITVLDCMSFANDGRFSFGNHGSKVRGLVGFSYRY